MCTVWANMSVGFFLLDISKIFTEDMCKIRVLDTVDYVYTVKVMVERSWDMYYKVNIQYCPFRFAYIL